MNERGVATPRFWTQISADGAGEIPRPARDDRGGRLGKVSLVGAGPGDPELITVRGLARVMSADVLIYDRLVHPKLVAEAPRTAERIFAGKQAGRATLDQRAIEALMVARAGEGLHVVRLKGGDPFVFGRGGEEVAALVAEGIPVEVVPGVTSAVAVPGAAGIPVTHRALSSSLTVVTAHEDPRKGGQVVDWDWLAAASGTLVVLMGLARLPEVCARLIAGGMASETPAAAVSNGTLPEQRVVTATLATLAEAAAGARLASPALIVVGEVVRLRYTLAAAALVGPLAADAPETLALVGGGQ